MRERGGHREGTPDEKRATELAQSASVVVTRMNDGRGAYHLALFVLLRIFAKVSSSLV